MFAVNHGPIMNGALSPATLHVDLALYSLIVLMCR